MKGYGLSSCTVSLVKDDIIERFIEKIGATYETMTGIKSQFYITEIGDSACRLI